MEKVFFLLALCFFSSGLLGAKELFTPQDKKILESLKSPEFFELKFKEKEEENSKAFFSFLLNLHSAEDKKELLSVDFSTFCIREDLEWIEEMKMRFLDHIHHLEDSP